MKLLKLTAIMLAVLATPTLVIAQEKSFTIGISNGFVGHEWRTQQIEETIAAAEAWKANGVDVTLAIQSKNVDVQGQIADVRNFVNQGVDAIVINPNSPTAFNPTYAAATARGITVIATDGEITSPDAIFVGIDQKDWGTQTAEWFVGVIGGKGEIGIIGGIAGHPANQARIEGLKEVLAKHPDITIASEANSDWDPVKAQQITQTMLATYPNLAGIWDGGTGEGVWRGIEAANKSSDSIATGESRVSFLRAWGKNGWNTGTMINPPGAMANALNVSVLLLLGETLDESKLSGPNGNALYLPMRPINGDNLQEILTSLADQPDNAFVSYVLSADVLKKRFFK